MKLNGFDKSTVSDTKLQLIEGLLKLMETKKFEDINVSQITEASFLARRTFYLNFDNKTDLLVYIIEILCNQCTTLLDQANKRSLYSITNAFFSYWYDYKDFLELLYKNNLFILLLTEFDNQSIFDIYFTGQIRQSFSLSQRVKDYSHSLNSTVLWRILMEWVINDYSDTVDEISQIYMSCTS